MEIFCICAELYRARPITVWQREDGKLFSHIGHPGCDWTGSLLTGSFQEIVEAAIAEAKKEIDSEHLMLAEMELQHDQHEKLLQQKAALS